MQSEKSSWVCKINILVIHWAINERRCNWRRWKPKVQMTGITYAMCTTSAVWIEVRLQRLPIYYNVGISFIAVYWTHSMSICYTLDTIWWQNKHVSANFSSRLDWKTLYDCCLLLRPLFCYDVRFFPCKLKYFFRRWYKLETLILAIADGIVFLISATILCRHVAIVYLHSENLNYVRLPTLSSNECWFFSSSSSHLPSLRAKLISRKPQHYQHSAPFYLLCRLCISAPHLTSLDCENK